MVRRYRMAIPPVYAGKASGKRFCERTIATAPSGQNLIVSHAVV